METNGTPKLVAHTAKIKAAAKADKMIKRIRNAQYAFDRAQERLKAAVLEYDNQKEAMILNGSWAAYCDGRHFSHHHTGNDCRA